MTFIPANAFGVATSGLYHVGYVVDGLQEAMDRFSDAIGTRWVDHFVQVRYRSATDAIVNVELHTSFSLDGPVHLELIEAAPGTIWELGAGPPAAPRRTVDRRHRRRGGTARPQRPAGRRHRPELGGRVGAGLLQLSRQPAWREGRARAYRHAAACTTGSEREGHRCGVARVPWAATPISTDWPQSWSSMVLRGGHPRPGQDPVDLRRTGTFATRGRVMDAAARLSFFTGLWASVPTAAHMSAAASWQPATATAPRSGRC